MEKLEGRLPVRDDVEELTYHRPPTASELRFGLGATHYADFPLDECCHSGTRIPKKWFISGILEDRARLQGFTAAKIIEENHWGKVTVYKVKL